MKNAITKEEKNNQARNLKQPNDLVFLKLQKRNITNLTWHNLSLLGSQGGIHKYVQAKE